MTALAKLIARFEELSCQALEPRGAAIADDHVRAMSGLSEPSVDFEGQSLASQIFNAERAVLNYVPDTQEERRLKLGFILQRMRELSDQGDEFDAYADAVRVLFVSD